MFAGNKIFVSKNCDDYLPTIEALKKTAAMNVNVGPDDRIAIRLFEKQDVDYLQWFSAKQCEIINEDFQ